MHYVCENFSLWLKFFAEITHKNNNNSNNNNIIIIIIIIIIQNSWKSTKHFFLEK